MLRIKRLQSQVLKAHRSGRRASPGESGGLCARLDEGIRDLAHEAPAGAGAPARNRGDASSQECAYFPQTKTPTPAACRASVTRRVDRGYWRWFCLFSACLHRCAHTTQDPVYREVGRLAPLAVRRAQPRAAARDRMTGPETSPRHKALFVERASFDGTMGGGVRRLYGHPLVNRGKIQESLVPAKRTSD